MEWVSQVLQLPVVVERGWPVSREFQLLEKLDFLRGRIARQRWILQEGLEPRLFGDGWDGFPFDELKFSVMTPPALPASRSRATG